MISIDEINDLQNKLAAKDRIIAVLKKTVKQWVKEYNILDGIIDIKDAEIQKLNDIIDSYQHRLEELKELKAENERLKLSERDLSKICQGFKKDIETEKSYALKYYKTLQEIKEIADRVFVAGAIISIDDIRNDYQQILQLIDKAEEE